MNCEMKYVGENKRAKATEIDAGSCIISKKGEPEMNNGGASCSSEIIKPQDSTCSTKTELVQEDDLYASFFLTFRKCAIHNGFEQLSKSIQEIVASGHFYQSLHAHIPTSEVHTSPLLHPNSSHKSCKYNILSLGSGSGVMDVHMLKCIAPHLKQAVTVEYCAVECNTVLFTSFAENVKALQTPFEINLFQCAESVESFLDQNYHGDGESFSSSFQSPQPTAKQQYDLILVAHFLYYAKDRHRTVEALFNSLKPNGRIIIIQHGPGGINQLQRLIGKQFNPTIDKILFNCYDVEELLKSVSYSSGYPIDYTVDLAAGFVDTTKCFIPEDGDGRKLMSFFVEANLMEKSEAEVQPIVEYLKAVSIRRVDHQDGELERVSWHMFHPTACIVVQHKHSCKK